MTQQWHAGEVVLTRFARDPTSLDDATASSLEAHLVSCERCRSALNARAQATHVEQSWSAIAVRIDRPRESIVELVLNRLGVSDGTARLLGATPALATAALAALAVIAAASVAASRATDTSGLFLVVAPLLPLLAVTTTFAPGSDPAGEAGIATPLHGIGLVLRRSAVILAAVFVLLGAADLAIGDLGTPVVAWLLPAWALAAGALALGTWFRADVSVVGLGSAWMVAVAVSRWMEGRDAGYAESAVFRTPGQLAASVVLMAATAVVVVRRDRFATVEVAR